MVLMRRPRRFQRDRVDGVEMAPRSRCDVFVRRPRSRRRRRGIPSCRDAESLLSLARLYLLAQFIRGDGSSSIARLRLVPALRRRPRRKRAPGLKRRVAAAHRSHARRARTVRRLARRAGDDPARRLGRRRGGRLLRVVGAAEDPGGRARRGLGLISLLF